MRPDILLIDEILAVGDESFRDKSRLAMKALVERAGNLVIASHRLKIFHELCEQIIWIDRGKVMEVGPNHVRSSRPTGPSSRPGSCDGALRFPHVHRTSPAILMPSDAARGGGSIR